MSTPILSFATKVGADDVRVDLPTLIESRLLIQANSGGGKTTCLRGLLEQTAGRLLHVVIDREGEFATLRAKYPYALVGPGGELAVDRRTAPMLARRIFERDISTIIDLSERSLDEQKAYVATFIGAINALPRDLWKDALIAIDEAHLFAPEKGKGESVARDAIAHLLSTGRKRGYCTVLATQRLAKLDKDVAAECLNKLIGRTSHIDVKRAGEELELDKKASLELRQLEPHQFYAYGPAIAAEPILTRTMPTNTMPPKRGASRTVPPPTPDAIRAIAGELADLPKEAAEEASTLDALKKQNADLRRQLGEKAKTNGHGPAKVVEKLIVDERAIQRAVAAAVKPYDDRLRAIRRPFERAVSSLRAAADLFEPVASLLGAEMPVLPALAATPPAVRPVSTPRVERPATKAEPTGALRGLHQRIVAALAELHAIGFEAPSREQVAFYLGVAASGGYFMRIVGELNTGGFVRYPTAGYLALTDAGIAEAGDVDPPDSIADLHARVRRHLSGLHERIFDVVVTEDPRAWTRVDLANAVNCEADGGYFMRIVGELKTAGILDYPEKGSVVAAADLYPEGLT